MAEGIFEIETDWRYNDWGFLEPQGGIAFAVVGRIATEQLSEKLEEAGQRLEQNDAVVLVSPHTVVDAARNYLADLRWRQQHPEEAARQATPKIILPS